MIVVEDRRLFEYVGFRAPVEGEWYLDRGILLYAAMEPSQPRDAAPVFKELAVHEGVEYLPSDLVDSIRQEGRDEVIDDPVEYGIEIADPDGSWQEGYDSGVSYVREDPSAFDLVERDYIQEHIEAQIEMGEEFAGLMEFLAQWYEYELVPQGEASSPSRSVSKPRWSD